MGFSPASRYNRESAANDRRAHDVRRDRPRGSKPWNDDKLRAALELVLRVRPRPKAEPGGG
jgi:hypothetical protein